LRGSPKELLRVDPLSPDTISAVLAGRRFDWVFHLASYRVRLQDRDIEPMFRVNVDATRRLIEIASAWPPRALVLVGTGAECAAHGTDQPLSEDQPLAGEAPHRLLSTLVDGLKSMRRVALTDGRQKRDFLFIDDAVDALTMLSESLERKPCQIIVNRGQVSQYRYRTSQKELLLYWARQLSGLGLEISRCVRMRPWCFQAIRPLSRTLPDGSRGSILIKAFD
jgi:nucleoside-diphosphate-sugar epimerase